MIYKHSLSTFCWGTWHIWKAKMNKDAGDDLWLIRISSKRKSKIAQIKQWWRQTPIQYYDPNNYEQEDMSSSGPQHYLRYPLVIRTVAPDVLCRIKTSSQSCSSHDGISQKEAIGILLQSTSYSTPPWRRWAPPWSNNLSCRARLMYILPPYLSDKQITCLPIRLWYHARTAQRKSWTNCVQILMTHRLMPWETEANNECLKVPINAKAQNTEQIGGMHRPALIADWGARSTRIRQITSCEDKLHQRFNYRSILAYQELRFHLHCYCFGRTNRMPLGNMDQEECSNSFPSGNRPCSFPSTSSSELAQRINILFGYKFSRQLLACSSREMQSR